MTELGSGQFDDFPIAKYYRADILDARTLMRAGRWWRAAVLIRDPKTSVTFMQLYLWEKRDGQWKRRSAYTIRKRAIAKRLLDYLDETLMQIEESA